MFVSPKTLREFCLQFLRQQINEEVDEDEVCGHTSTAVNGHLVEELLESLSANCQLTDETLLRPIFDSKSTQLKSVRIPDGSRLTARGLRTLRGHRIEELLVNGLQKCTINELIGCLGEHSLQRLRSLNVSQSSFTASNKV